MKRRSFIQTLPLLSVIGSTMNISELSAMTDSFKKTAKMPVAFLGHGSPMNAIEENDFVRGFRTIATRIPKPQAILCISAHWYTRGTMVTAMEKPKTIHDFGGFPKELYEVQYPAPGSPALARLTKEIIEPTTKVGLDDSWGLDHGAWSVVKHLYPKADIPIIQMSIDYTQPPEYHYKLGSLLASLREKGVFIVGSGNIIHNLRLVDFANINTPGFGFDWAHEAHELTNTRLLNGNFKELVDYKNLGKSLQLAVPTPDHYLPLLYILGLKQEKEKLELFNDELLAGSLSMTSVVIG